MILKQNFIFGNSLYDIFLILTTLQEENTKEWHTILRGGHFFSCYQPEIKELMNKTYDKTEAIKKHNIIIKRIYEKKNEFVQNFVEKKLGPGKCI